MKIIEPKVELWQQGDDSKAQFGYLNPYYRSAYNIPKRRK